METGQRVLEDAVEVFQIDLRWPTAAGDSHQKFKALASQRAAWRFNVFDVIQPAIDPGTWHESVLRAVDRAQVVVCFGDYTLFPMAGDRGAEIVDRLIDKATQGCPFLLSLRRFAETESRNQNALKLLGRFEVLPTLKKVWDCAPEHDGGISPYNIKFSKSDDCLRDLTLFNGVSEVLVHAANLLNYDGDAVPIIEASALQYYTDQGDLLTQGALGRHPCVAVGRRSNDRELQLIIGGSVFSDPADVLSGSVPGIDRNQTFALRVIDMLTNNVRLASRRALSAYASFSRLERLLGKFVQEVAEAELVDRDFVSILPPEVLDRCFHPSGGQPGYHNAHFPDIIKILLSNWDLYNRHFVDESSQSISRSKIKRALDRVYHGKRHYLAHPHRAEQEGIVFDDDDIRVIDEARVVVERAYRRFAREFEG
jgi:hypothetical protein